MIQLFAKTAQVESGVIEVLKSIGRWFEILALAVLVVVVTNFLVKEAAGFYLDANESLLCAYIKAGMVEGIAILFSFSRGKSIFLRRSQQILVVLLCGFTLGTMSGKLIKTASGDTVRVQTLMQTVSDLESERAQKEVLRQELVGRQWLGAARKYEKGLDQIRQKLAAARESLASEKAPQVVMTNLGILISFRLLLVAANLVCLHRLVEYFSCDSERKQGVLT